MDTLTFEKIYETYHAKVENLVRYSVKGNKEIAEELTNDIFLKVNNHLSNFDSQQSMLNTWIMNITKNTIIDYRRKRKLDTISIDARIGDDNDDSNKTRQYFLESNSSNPHELLISDELKNILLQSFDSLPENQRNIGKLYFLNEHKYSEIADKLDCPLGTVKATVYRVRKMFETILNKK